MLYHVKDLSPDQRLVVEALLGRAVSDEEAVSVRAVAPTAIVESTFSNEQRRRALEGLKVYFDKADSRRKPVTEAEEEAIITEAIGASSAECSRCLLPLLKSIENVWRCQRQILCQILAP